jgi:hypothetical protein
MSDEFFVGYLAPPRVTGRRMRVIAVALVVFASLVAVVLALATGPFDHTSFEFATLRDWQGTIEAAPVPVLIVEGAHRLPLVAPGTHGAGPAVAPFDGMTVALRAKRIVRDGTTMLEIEPGSIRSEGDSHRNSDARAPIPSDAPTATFTGEIVDSKCFLGAMNPGRLEVHRACAMRCIAGGIPPMLFTHDAGGRELRVLLVGSEGEPINDRVLPYVATPVSIEGRLVRYNDLDYLYVLAIR